MSDFVKSKYSNYFLPLCYMEHRKLLNIELGRISAPEYRAKASRGVVLVLDNIRSAHNVGSAFRTADAFGVDMIYLCGICATPASPEIHKSALGAEDSVAWRYVQDTLDAVIQLKEQGFTVISVEQTVGSVMLDRLEWTPDRKYALVFGNEVEGVSQQVVDASDMTLEIPQWGTKHSLNVSVSVGVVLWAFRPR